MTHFNKHSPFDRRPARLRRSFSPRVVGAEPRPSGPSCACVLGAPLRRVTETRQAIDGPHSVSIGPLRRLRRRRQPPGSRPAATDSSAPSG